MQIKRWLTFFFISVEQYANSAKCFSFLVLIRFLLFIGMFGNITYALVGDYSVNFNVDSISGTITVQNSSFLDRERLPEASFSAVAVDKAPITTRHSAIVPVNIYFKFTESSHLHRGYLNIKNLTTKKKTLINLIFVCVCVCDLDSCYDSRCQRQ